MLVVELSNAWQIFLFHFLHDRLELSIFLRGLFLISSSSFVFSIHVSLQVSVTLKYLVAGAALASLRVICLFNVLVKSFFSCELISASHAD